MSTNARRQAAQNTAGPGNPDTRDAVAIRDTVARILKKLGLEEETWTASLAEVWTELVGEDVARHARPGVVKDRCLIVYVDSSPWLSELSRYGQGRMLKNIQGRFGRKRVSTIRLQLDPDRR